MQQNHEAELLESFEAVAPALSDFESTALSTSTQGTPTVAGTGFSTCPAKTGKYC